MFKIPANTELYLVKLFTHRYWISEYLDCTLYRPVFISYAQHKNSNSVDIPGMKILWKRTVFARKFRSKCPKLWKSYAFPQNFHTRKPDEVSVFCVVMLEYTALMKLCIRVCFKQWGPLVSFLYFYCSLNKSLYCPCKPLLPLSNFCLLRSKSL